MRKRRDFCPVCHGILTPIGSVGITIHELGDVQTDRFDCDTGHTILACDTDRIDQYQDEKELKDRA